MNEEKPIEQKESIKLTKNAKGDYQWEIKVFGSDKIGPDEVKVLEDIDKDLEEKFGKK